MPSIIRGDGTSSFGGDLSIDGVLTYEDVSSVDSVGIITARSGIDIGTGTSISSPSSNVLALGTNNGERLRITSGGRVGIGTDDPTAHLQVYRQTQFASNPIIQARSNNGSTNELKFEIDGDGDAYFAGNVGIGTDNPSKKLDIRTDSVEAGIVLNSSGRTLVMTTQEESGVSQAAKIGTTSNHELRIITNDEERLRVDSVGRILAGTTSFTGEASLVLQASNAGDTTQAQLWLNRGETDPTADNVLGQIIFGDATAAGSGGAMIQARADSSWGGANGNPSRIAFFTESFGSDDGPDERLRIDSAGSVMIGTTLSRNNLLRVAGSIGQDASASASAQTTGDFVITVSGLATLNNSRHLRAALLVFYSGIDNNSAADTLLLSVVKIGGLTTYNYQSTTDIVGTTSVSAVGSSQTNNGVQLSFNVSDSNRGGVYAMLIGHGSCNISIAG